MTKLQQIEYGQGLNSLRIRFTVMVAFFCSTVAAIAIIWLESERGHFSHDFSMIGLFALGFAILGSAGTTFLMTGKLTRPIENLKASTEAIAKGDYDTVVSVDCQCEVGGLADSFRLMVARLNDNVAKINSLAYEDDVTGLPNRAVLYEVLENVSRDSGYVLFIDLDRFKQVNDVHGHHVGDLILKHAARRFLVDVLHTTPETISRCLVPQGRDIAYMDSRLLFRFAGDEFVCLLAGIHSKKDVIALAERIIDCLKRPFPMDDRNILIGASIGVARIGLDSSKPDELIRYADIAMYDAKQSGRGRVSFFDDRMRREAIETSMLEHDFTHAIERRQLEVHYQPKVSLSDRTVMGLEALVRWRHPERGLLFPGTFIKIAESSGLLDKLGREVLRLAAGHIAEWRAQGKAYPVAINICPTQFADDAFVITLTDYVASIGASPADFELEVTETIAMSDLDKAQRQFKDLKEGGFCISIDDFGVGFSNLAQLTKLPYDCLKVDRSLIENLEQSHDARTIVSAVVGMAHGLGHRVVAEGVETQGQLDLLRILGCDIAQGYFISRPMAFEEITQQLSLMEGTSTVSLQK